MNCLGDYQRVLLGFPFIYSTIFLINCIIIDILLVNILEINKGLVLVSTENLYLLCCEHHVGLVVLLSNSLVECTNVLARDLDVKGRELEWFSDETSEVSLQLLEVLNVAAVNWGILLCAEHRIELEAVVLTL